MVTSGDFVVAVALMCALAVVVRGLAVAMCVLLVVVRGFAVAMMCVLAVVDAGTFVCVGPAS